MLIFNEMEALTNFGNYACIMCQADVEIIGYHFFGLSTSSGTSV